MLFISLRIDRLRGREKTAAQIHTFSSSNLIPEWHCGMWSSLFRVDQIPVLFSSFVFSLAGQYDGLGVCTCVDCFHTHRMSLWLAANEAKIVNRHGRQILCVAKLQRFYSNERTILIFGFVWGKFNKTGKNCFSFHFFIQVSTFNRNLSKQFHCARLAAIIEQFSAN